MSSVSDILFTSPIVQPPADTSTSAMDEKGSGGMSVDDFYTLLAAQLKYQDADNPMDTSEMMAQMVQTQMITAIEQMTMANTQIMLISQTSYTVSMVGKTVTLAELDENGMYSGENTTGVVTGVTLGDSPVVFVDGKSYSLAQVMSIGEVPELPEDDTADDTNP